MSLLKKNIYEIVCKDAKGGKEAWEMLQEYVYGTVYEKLENTSYEDDYCEIADNIFTDCEKIKARNIKEVDEFINNLIEKELLNN